MYHEMIVLSLLFVVHLTGLSGGLTLNHVMKAFKLKFILLAVSIYMLKFNIQKLEIFNEFVSYKTEKILILSCFSLRTVDEFSILQQ
jgi:hypothetical protein